MNNGMLLIGLMLAGLFLFRRQSPWDQPSDFSYTGGAGTGYGVDIWGDEG